MGAAFTNLSLLYHLFCFDVFEFTFLLSFICYLGVQVGLLSCSFIICPPSSVSAWEKEWKSGRGKK